MTSAKGHDPRQSSLFGIHVYEMSADDEQLRPAAASLPCVRHNELEFRQGRYQRLHPVSQSVSLSVCLSLYVFMRPSLSAVVALCIGSLSV